MEPTLVLIGISLRSAKLSVRERFLMDSAQKSAALSTLVRSDAVDEVIVLSTCNRTEFLVWTQDASEAANSVLRFLAHSSNLTLAEWSNFYRLVGDEAVAHVLRVSSGLDSAVFGESEAASSTLSAWQQAQRASTTGRFLDFIERISSDGSTRSFITQFGPERNPDHSPVFCDRLFWRLLSRLQLMHVPLVSVAVVPSRTGRTPMAQYREQTRPSSSV